jgi:hypothetical protein
MIIKMNVNLCLGLRWKRTIFNGVVSSDFNCKIGDLKLIFKESSIKFQADFESVNNATKATTFKRIKIIYLVQIYSLSTSLFLPSSLIFFALTLVSCSLSHTHTRGLWFECSRKFMLTRQSLLYLLRHKVNNYSLLLCLWKSLFGLLP